MTRVRRRSWQNLGRVGGRNQGRRGRSPHPGRAEEGARRAGRAPRHGLLEEERRSFRRRGERVQPQQVAEHGEVVPERPGGETHYLRVAALGEERHHRGQHLGHLEHVVDLISRFTSGGEWWWWVDRVRSALHVVGGGGRRSVIATPTTGRERPVLIIGENKSARDEIP